MTWSRWVQGYGWKWRRFVQDNKEPFKDYVADVIEGALNFLCALVGHAGGCFVFNVNRWPLSWAETRLTRDEGVCHCCGRSNSSPIREPGPEQEQHSR